jgi:glycosyltransferase involved in cell wall biosynthesis
MKRVEVIIATNALIKSRLVRKYGKRLSDKIKVIRSSLRFSDDQLDFYTKAHSNCTFYQISRIVPQRRIDRGLKLSSALKSHGFTDSWKIVGDGYLRSKLEISEWQNNLVNFIGFQDSHEALRNACGLVQTSDYEGLPLVIIEALSMGIPVFSTMTGDLEWLREQLPKVCRPMLMLIHLEHLNELENRFLSWRLNFELECDMEIREKTSAVIKNLFNVEKSAEAYLSIFQVSQISTFERIEL